MVLSPPPLLPLGGAGLAGRGRDARGGRLHLLHQKRPGQQRVVGHQRGPHLGPRTGEAAG